MQAWRGWTATAATPTTRTTRALTWAEWRAWQQRTPQDGERCHDGTQLTSRELARLSFMRWRYQTGRLGSRGQDNV